LSLKIRLKAKRRGVDYSFLFIRADGEQLSEIARLVDKGVIRPVIDQIFPFERTPDAMARVQSGRTKGKVIVDVRTRSRQMEEPLSCGGTAHG
jgi:NADPH:quinone reductase-like Zn-dependent oxidoreductase